MSTTARRDAILEEIRTLPVEDREFIEATLMRDAYNLGREFDDQAELERRADEAIAHPERGLTRQESATRARASLDAARTRKP